MIILIDSKISKKFNTKSLFKKKIRKLGIKGIFVNFIYSIYKNPIANNILSAEKLDTLPLRFRLQKYFEGRTNNDFLMNRVQNMRGVKKRIKGF